MESEDVLKTIEEIEAVAGALADNNAPARTPGLKTELERLLEGLVGTLVRQTDSAEKEFLTEIVELLMMLNSKYKFDEVLGSGIKYTLLAHYVNALIYQKDWKFEKLSFGSGDIAGLTVTQMGLTINCNQAKESQVDKT